MHKTLYFFPNFNQNNAIFPNSKGPGPIPKKGCESPVRNFEVDRRNCTYMLFYQDHPKNWEI